MLLPLRGAIKNYDWGSRTALPAFLGQDGSGQPVAELWLGAHPAGPATAVVDGRPVALDALLERRPELAGGRPGLPFLVKVLAAERCLSLQAHPDSRQAAAGFEREERSGVPLDAPTRNYRDRSAKPELLVALGEFRALAGVRPLAETRRIVEALAAPAVSDAFAALAGARTAAAGPPAVAATLRALLTLPADWARTLYGELTAAARRVAGAPDPAVARYADLVAVLAEQHPGDVGAAAAMLLNDVTLRPGDALYQPAGSLHAYVQGLAVEAMACSDNVLRGGLTGKHVDVDELLAIVDATPGPPLRPALDGRPLASWQAPDGAFTVHRLTPGGTPLTPPVDGPAVLLVVDGTLRAAAGGSSRDLARGEAVLVPASHRVTVDGDGTGYLVGCA